MRKLRTKARAVENSHEWGFANTGTEQVGIRVQAIGGELDGQSFTWYGYFTEASEDRTLESLRIAGWDGTDIINLPGVGSTEFELQLEEEANDDGSVRLKAGFINRIGVAMKNAMDAQQKAAFAARMRPKIGGAGARPAQSNGGRSKPANRPAAGGFDSPPPSDEDWG